MERDHQSTRFPLHDDPESKIGYREVSPLTDAHKILQRRLNTYGDNPKAGSPWEEVKARLRGPTE
jgi:putative addiction module component (TIGR02574 family)